MTQEMIFTTTTNSNDTAVVDNSQELGNEIVERRVAGAQPFPVTVQIGFLFSCHSSPSQYHAPPAIRVDSQTGE